MQEPTGYFYKQKYDFYEVMGWEFSNSPAYDLGCWTWGEYAQKHPGEEHVWTHTFELVGTTIWVYLFDEENF